MQANGDLDSSSISFAISRYQTLNEPFLHEQADIVLPIGAFSQASSKAVPSFLHDEFVQSWLQVRVLLLSGEMINLHDDSISDLVDCKRRRKEGSRERCKEKKATGEERNTFFFSRGLNNKIRRVLHLKVHNQEICRSKIRDGLEEKRENQGREVKEKRGGVAITRQVRKYIVLLQLCLKVVCSFFTKILKPPIHHATSRVAQHAP
ncbi:hypothetical protein GGI43DRAFT_178276 [Trichoderma evansii]